MSLSQLKKEAKNLHRLIPDFLARHPDGGKLSDVQELYARIKGYPSFYALVTTREEKGKSALFQEEKKLSLGKLGLVLVDPIPDKGKKPTHTAIFAVSGAGPFSFDSSLDRVTDEFDEACENAVGLTGDFNDYSYKELQKLIRLSEKLIKKEPAFVDGYAFQVGAYGFLKEFNKALGHLPVGIDLWHDSGEGPHAVVAFQAGNIEVDGHSPAMAWQVTDKQGFLLMDDHSACWPT